MSTKLNFFSLSGPSRPDLHIVPPRRGMLADAKSKQAKSPRKKLHRVASVRREQDVSIRTAASKLKCHVSEARMKEEETYDLRVSELLQWQRVLDVPLVDLLVEPDLELSNPVSKRAELLRAMKTAVAIKETVKCSRARRHTEMLLQQLVAIMPELENVLAWPSVGQRRDRNEFGKIAERSVDERLISGS